MRSVVIGASREQKLCSLVLESSIRNNTKLPDLSIIHTYDKTFPIPIHEKNKSKTGFSFNRFAIPELVGYQGVGVYLECDQLVFADVKELFDLPFEGATMLRPKNQAAVLVLDCDKLKWNVADIVKGLDAGKYTYHQLMENVCIEPAENIVHRVPEVWNTLESYKAGVTKLLHYTNMVDQPWRKWGHPLTHLWMKELKRSMVGGLVTIPVIEKEVNRKYVVPQVLKEAKAWRLP